jgi:hypothetical protein
MSTSSHDIKLNGDGMVLYSSESQSLYRLNGTAAYIWSLLRRRSDPLNTEQIHAALQLEAKRLRLEGADSFSLAATKELVQRLVQLGLVDGPDRSEATAGCGLARLAPKARTFSTNTGEQRIAVSTVVWVLFLFAAIDVYLKLAGFNSLLTRIKDYPTELSEPRSAINVCIAALDHAQVYYPKKEMCLRRSAALTLLLRDKGYSAQMVVGAQPYPAKAHAWVELNDQVIGDSVRIKGLYHELFRV